MKKSLVLVFNSQRNKNHCEYSAHSFVYVLLVIHSITDVPSFFCHLFFFQHKENIWFLRFFLLHSSILSVRMHAFSVIDFIFRPNLTLYSILLLLLLVSEHQHLLFASLDSLGVWHWYIILYDFIYKQIQWYQCDCYYTIWLRLFLIAVNVGVAFVVPTEYSSCCYV